MGEWIVDRGLAWTMCVRPDSGAGWETHVCPRCQWRGCTCTRTCVPNPWLLFLLPTVPLPRGLTIPRTHTQHNKRGEWYHILPSSLPTDPLRNTEQPTHIHTHTLTQTRATTHSHRRTHTNARTHMRKRVCQPNMRPTPPPTPNSRHTHTPHMHTPRPVQHVAIHTMHVHVRCCGVARSVCLALGPTPAGLQCLQGG
jgi:hypothetical protein